MREYESVARTSTKAYLPLMAAPAFDHWSDPSAQIGWSGFDSLGANATARTFSSAGDFGAFPAEQSLLRLQRRHGNRYVQRLMASARTQQLETPVLGGAPGSAPVLAPAPVNAGSAGQDAPTAGCTTSPPAKDSRAIFDNLCLLSTDLKDDDRLNDAFHNNPPLTARDNSDSVQKLQQALLDVGEVLPKFGADGKWGQETTSAVVSFQSKNGIQPGGFEAGRKTLLALDTHLQQNPPKPPSPPPGQNTTVTAQCGKDQQAGSVVVTGTGFPPGQVNLSVDGAAGNSALADDKGNFSGSVPSSLKDGSHVVEASAGSVHQFAQFTTPCGAKPPGPNDVTQDELLVLTKYQFMEQAERDATEDAIRDLRSSLDKAPAPFITSLIEAVGETVIQFVYGSFEQVLRTAVKGLFPAPDPNKPKQQDAGTIVDNAHDKASDFLEDFGKDGLKDAIKDEHDAPVKALEEQLEGFRRPLLKGLREGYFQLSTRWIQSLHSDPATKDITPDELQGLAQGLDQTGRDIYKLRYDHVVQAWASYIAQSRPGAKPNLTVKPDPNRPGQFIQVAVTALPKMNDGTAPVDHPGVLFIHIFSSNVKPKLATEIMQAGSDENVAFNPPHIDQQDMHIFGLSEPTRQSLANGSPTVGSLAMPVVFRGDPVDGGEVAIAKDESGTVRDISKDSKGSEWLAGAGEDFTHEHNPDAGARDLFNESLNAAIDTNSIKGP